MNEVFPKTGKFIAVTSLILALLAFFPSIAPFTPAIILSAFSFIGALMGALSGWVRTAILTIYTVIATILVSPISSWVESYIDLRALVILSVVTGCFFCSYLVYQLPEILNKNITSASREGLANSAVDLSLVVSTSIVL